MTDKAQPWKDAKQKCWLNDENIAIANRLDMNSLSLIKEHSQQE